MQMCCANLSRKRTLAIVIILVLAAILSIGLGLGLGLRSRNDDDDCQQATPPTTTPSPTHSPLYVPPSDTREGHYKFAAVAADAEECSKLGTRMMGREGASAVDAAIATILCVGVYNSHSCGIGGGHFLTYYKRETGVVKTVIGREQAPSGATSDMYAPGKNVSSQEGGQSIGIPGEIRGLYEAHELGGRLAWSTLFQPAIRLCRDGFRVGKALGAGIEASASVYSKHPNLKAMVTNPATGALYREGEIMRRPLLARTLDIIANEGPNAFYNGSLAENITLDIREAGGIITKSDLANYTAEVKDPVLSTIHGNRRVYSPPPPSSGAIYQFILNILNGYQFSNASVSTVDAAILTYHRVAEAFKHAYALRTLLGDRDVGSPAFQQHVDELVTNLTSTSFSEARRAMIDDDRTFNWTYYEPSFTNTWDHGTAHLSVLAPNGDAVAITSTVNLFFGSKVVGTRTGIVFNDQMDDFSTPNTTNYFGVPASPANFIEPWKRPLSSMCPSIVVGPDGDVILVVGGSGGTKITTASALVTMDSLWFDWGIKESIDYPRIHHQLFPPELQVFEGFPQVLIDGLRAKGHDILMKSGTGSVVQGVLQRQQDEVTANSDYRKHSEADGY